MSKKEGYSNLYDLVPRQDEDDVRKKEIVEIVYEEGEPYISQSFYKIVSLEKPITDYQKVKIHNYVCKNLGYEGTVETLFAVGELDSGSRRKQGRFFNNSMNVRARIAIDLYNSRFGTTVSTLAGKTEEFGLNRGLIERLYYGYQEPKKKHRELLSKSLNMVPQFFEGKCNLPYELKYSEFVAEVDKRFESMKSNREVVTGIIDLLSREHKILLVEENNQEFQTFLNLHKQSVIDEICQMAVNLETEFYQSKGLSVYKNEDDYDELYFTGSEMINGTRVPLPLGTSKNPATGIFAALNVVEYPWLDEGMKDFMHKRTELLLWILENHEEYYVKDLYRGNPGEFNKELEIEKINELMY